MNIKLNRKNKLSKVTEIWVKPIEPIDWETSPATQQPAWPLSPHPTPPNRQQRHEKQVAVANPAAIKHRKQGPRPATRPQEKPPSLLYILFKDIDRWC